MTKVGLTLQSFILVLTLFVTAATAHVKKLICPLQELQLEIFIANTLD